MSRSVRTAWIIAGVSTAASVGAVALVGLTADFVRALVGTFVGAVLGFLVALYLERVQRMEAEEARLRQQAAAEEDRRRQQGEDDRKQRERQLAAERREADRQREIARDRRVALLSLLREELGRVPDQMGQRQNRNQPPFDRMIDILWRSFTASSELRWIEDVELLRKIASAYDLISVEIALEARWIELRVVTSGNAPQADHFIANQLRRYDNDTWRRACDACKAIDDALRADGAPPGENAAKLFCP
jgi:hypothetical protein